MTLKIKRKLPLFLDKAMEDIKKGDDAYRSEFKTRYSTAIERCYQLLGEKGFEKILHQEDGQKRNAVWSLMVMLVKLTENEFSRLVNKQAEFQGKVQALLENTEFINAISYSTQRKEHVEIRYEKVNALINEVLNDWIY